jgi:hypothetical protein
MTSITLTVMNTGCHEKRSGHPLEPALMLATYTLMLGSSTAMRMRTVDAIPRTLTADVSEIFGAMATDTRHQAQRRSAGHHHRHNSALLDTQRPSE